MNIEVVTQTTTTKPIALGILGIRCIIIHSTRNNKGFYRKRYIIPYTYKLLDVLSFEVNSYHMHIKLNWRTGCLWANRDAFIQLWSLHARIAWYGRTLILLDWLILASSQPHSHTHKHTLEFAFANNVARQFCIANCCIFGTAYECATGGV